MSFYHTVFKNSLALLVAVNLLAGCKPDVPVAPTPKPPTPVTPGMPTPPQYGTPFPGGGIL